MTNHPQRVVVTVTQPILNFVAQLYLWKGNSNLVTGLILRARIFKFYIQVKYIKC